MQGHAAESQKLIYSGMSHTTLLCCRPRLDYSSGKVLPDSKTVESCEIKEKDFLVLMVSKVCFIEIDTTHSR